MRHRAPPARGRRACGSGACWHATSAAGGNARQAQPLVALECSFRVDRPLPQAGGERGAVLDRLCRALSHERVHWVTGVAEQRCAAYRPSRQRIAVEQGPDEAGLGGGDNAADLRVPALEGGERAGDGGAVVQSSRFQVSCSVQPTKFSRRPRDTK